MTSPVRWGHLSGVEVAGIISVIVAAQMLLGFEVTGSDVLGMCAGVFVYRLAAPVVAEWIRRRRARRRQRR